MNINIEELPPEEFLDKLVELKSDYYAGHPQISDAEYDRLEESFREQYPEYVDQLPVGTTLDEFEKVEHPVPMGSLEKAKSGKTVTNWIYGQMNRYEGASIVVQPKFDGAAIELIYEDGELEYMLTRGKENRGEDVTHVARVLDHIPNVLPDAYPELHNAIIRGEAVLHKEDHPNEARRNLATGTLKSLDPTKSIDRNLKVYIHTIVDAYRTEYVRYEDIFERLDEIGFLTTPFWYEIDNWDEPWFNVPYDVDGAVIKAVNGKEKSALAYKFPDDSLYSDVRGIRYQLGRTMKITPVLKVEPVMKDGRQLSSVSLGSYDILREAQIGEGDRVEVTFANDVIPHLEAVVERTDSPRFQCTECPECGGDVEMNGAHLYCTNYDSRHFWKNKFKSMLGSMKVDGLGSEMKKDLGEMYDYDYSEFVTDFYTSDDVVPRLKQIDGWGSRTARNVHSQVVECIDNLSWYRLFSILSLEGFGGKTRTKYIREHSDDPWPLTESKLRDVDQVEYKTARKVMESFDITKHHGETLLGLAGNDLSPGVVLEDEERTGVLDGEEIFVTGTLNYGTRSEFKDLIREHGGEFGKSPDAILVTNNMDSSSNKAKYARDKECMILTEEEFFDEFDLEVGS